MSATKIIGLLERRNITNEGSLDEYRAILRKQLAEKVEVIEIATGLIHSSHQSREKVQEEIQRALENRKWEQEPPPSE